MTTKPEITIFDDNFDCHEKDVTGRLGSAFASFPDLTRWPKDFNWNRDRSKITDLCVFTDNCLSLAKDVNCKTKIAWILEPYEWDSRPYHFLKIQENREQFDLILTHDLRLIIECPNAQFFCPSGGAWIRDEDFSIYPKKADLSMFMSYKQTTSGHRLRHYLLGKYGSSGFMDFYVSGYKLINAVRDYRFTVVVENTNAGILSEKIISPILCGTVPIYWGSPKVSEYFDDRGILIFNKELDLHKHLENLKEDFQGIYESKLPYIKHNFEIAKSIFMTDDLLWKEHFEKFAV